MDGQQPGNIYTPGQSEDEQPKTTGNGASDEIAQIDNAVQQNPVAPANVQDYGDTETQAPASTRVELNNTPQTPEPGPIQDGDLRGLPVVNKQAVNESEEPPLQTQQSNPVEESGSEKAPSLLLSWQSSGDRLERGLLWHVVLFTATIAFAALILLVVGSWLSAIVVVLASVSLIVVNSKGPQVQAYGIFNEGIQIDERFYEYEQLRSFSLSQLNDETLIEIEPGKRFYPRITMHISDSVDQAQELLGRFLPKNDREPDMVDKLSQRFKL